MCEVRSFFTYFLHSFVLYFYTVRECFLFINLSYLSKRFGILSHIVVKFHEQNVSRFVKVDSFATD